VVIAEEHPSLFALLSALDPDDDAEHEADQIADFVRTSDVGLVRAVIADIDAALSRDDLPTDEVQRLVHHRLVDDLAARTWLDGIRIAIEAHLGEAGGR
jgi:hypothetical protein